MKQYEYYEMNNEYINNKFFKLWLYEYCDLQSTWIKVINKMKLSLKYKIYLL